MKKTIFVFLLSGGLLASIFIFDIGKAQSVGSTFKVGSNSSVAITATVDFSLTGILEKNIARGETNWRQGYWIEKKDKNYIIFAKF